MSALIIFFVVLIVCLLIFSFFIDAVAKTPVLNVVVGLFLIISTWFYLLPVGIHLMRGLPRAASKFWFNFLLGWTVIVWIWGVITACTAKSNKNALKEFVDTF